MSTTSTTTSAAPMRNPKDSIKSTWRTQSRSTWTPFHWFYEILNIHGQHLNEQVPVHKKTDGMPYAPDWQMHLWVIIHAAVPLLLQQAYCHYTGNNLSIVGAFFLYSTFFKINAIHELWFLRTMGHKLGFLDGDEHARDGIPDVGVSKVFFSLITTSSFRPLFSVFLAYKADQTPADMAWKWLFIEAGLYGIILDFWFYWYHRLMHEVPNLWKFHRTHHLTKHPNPLLTLYADLEQEIFDIAGIPLFTYFSMKLMGFPMGFYEWWICHQYVVFAELAGHSGLRLHASPPNTLTFILRWFDAELVIEDHDMHHRKGWKDRGGNYGKQTRLWDRLFGTCTPRIESEYANVDWNNPVNIPLY